MVGFYFVFFKATYESLDGEAGEMQILMKRIEASLPDIYGEEGGI